MGKKRHAGITAAIAHFGTQKKLVEALRGWSQQTISRTLNCENPVSAELAVAIHNATNGHVPKHALRPDLFAEVAESGSMLRQVAA